MPSGSSPALLLNAQAPAALRQLPAAQAARYAALVDQLPRPPTGEPLYYEYENGVITRDR